MFSCGQTAQSSLSKSVGNSGSRGQKNGGATAQPSHLFVPQLELVASKEFIYVPLYKNKAFLTQKYVTEGCSVAQIAEEICSSKDAVRNGLIGFGIPIREPRQHHGHPSQPRYGQLMNHGRAVPHLTEQRTVQAISEMHQQGLSLRQIARILTQMKIPTKCRGRSWHPQMVKRVLDTHGSPKK